MSSARTRSNWPYRAAKPGRARRVVRAEERQGPQSRNAASAAITPRQARRLLLVMLAAGALVVAWWLYRSPYLTVHEIEVVGATRLDEQHVRDVADIDGQSAFRLDLEAAERRLEALPEVRAATIEKHGWTGATITIEERTPWGSWQVDGVNVAVDIDGYVLGGGTAPEGAPVIVEVEPQRVIEDGDRLDPGAIQLAARLTDEAERAFGRRVLGFAYRQSAGLTVVLSGADIEAAPVWVTFGDSRDYEYKVRALYVLLEQAREAQLRVTAVDLRFGSRLSFN